MFFEAHPEGRIGYKQLTDADLGRALGNITHIGLFDAILTFLPNHYEGSAMFIYDDKAEIIDMFFDRIGRKSGVFNSPKIKKGGRNVVSVVTVIHDIVAQNPALELKWYLIWFGLKSEESVFFLFHSQSEHFHIISEIIDLTQEDVKSRIEYGNRSFDRLLKYLEHVVNQSSTEIQEQLEVVSQTGGTSADTHKFRPFDIEKANELFRRTGREGESLVAEYLDMLKFNKQITEFCWMNKDRESGYPYDFSIQSNDQLIIHADVKSTAYKFEQPMIFSNQEIAFIVKVPNYQIFRVYDLSEQHKHLRICENSKLYVPNLHSCINGFQESLSTHQASVHSVKIAISPTMDKLLFSPEITL